MLSRSLLCLIWCRAESGAYRNLDVSSTKIYEISDTTKELLDSLDEEVDMKVLAVKDETDDRITTFLSRYASLSGNINMEWIDPVLHPSALTEYDTTENNIVVSCEATGKTTTISFDDILVPDMYSYYYYGNMTYTSFDGGRPAHQRCQLCDERY